MVIGFLWYGTWAFGRSWMQLSGRGMDQGQQAGPMYALTAVAAIVGGIGMKNRCEQLGAIHEEGARPAEVRRAVDRDDERAVDRWNFPRFVRALFGIPAAGHRDDDVGPRGAEVVPGDLARARARGAENIGAAGDRDLLGNPVPTVERWVEPLEAGHARALAVANPIGDRPPARARRVDERFGLTVAPERGADPPNVGEHPLERPGLERHHRRRLPERRRDALERQ